MEVWVGAGVELGEGEEDRSFRVKLDSLLSRPPLSLAPSLVSYTPTLPPSKRKPSANYIIMTKA